MPSSPLPRWSLPVAAPPRITWTALWRHGPGESTYVLPAHWTLHLVHYRAPFRVGEFTTELKPGRLVLVAPGVPTTTWLERESNHYFAHFKFPPEASRKTAHCPSILDPGHEVDRFEGLFSELVTMDPEDSHLAEVLLWGILLRLPHLVHASRRKAYPPKLGMALQQIEERLGEGITVRELCHRVEVSETHLARLFQKHLGLSVIGHIRKRRLERARYLLTHAPRTITEIAHAVGMRDLQYFNKQIRGAFGVSPRALREKGGLNRPRVP